MTGFVERFQPHLIEKWKDGTDIAPHPEDPDEVKEEIYKRAKDPVKYAKMMEQKHYKPKFILRYETKYGETLIPDPIEKKLICKTEDWDEEEEKRYIEWQKMFEDYVCVEIYRHIELSHVEVKVNPMTKELMDYNGLSFLRARLGRPHIKSFKSLLECGAMFKVDREMVHKSEIREKEVKVDPIKQAIKEEDVGADENDKDDDDDKDDDFKKTPVRKPKAEVKKPAPAPTPEIKKAEYSEDSDADSYYSSDGDYDSSDSDSSRSDISSGDDSEFDDPDFGKAKRKRRKVKLSKKEKKLAKKMRRMNGERASKAELDAFTKSIFELLITMKELRGISSVENKENEPEKGSEVTKENGIKVELPEVKMEVDESSNGQLVSDENTKVEGSSSASAAEEKVKEEPWVKEGEPLYFDVERLTKAKKMPQGITVEQIKIMEPIFYGLEVLEKRVRRFLMNFIRKLNCKFPLFLK